MSIKELSFPSANGRDTVKGWAYTPLGKPRAVIQLIHGFGEHSRRYLHMISKFQQAGFAVYADDHIGHGKTAYDSNTMGKPGSGGFMTYLKDEKSLHDIARSDYPELPYFVFGHSWGSMLARAYGALFGEDLTGLMLCGLVSQFKGQAMFANKDFRAAAKGRPNEPAGEWFGKVFTGMTDRIENPNGPSDWIANDPDVVADHAGDMFNTFDVTVELVWDLIELGDFIESPDWAAKVPVSLPVYLISGDQDPCGNYGEGLYHVANLLAESGNKVRVKAYPGYRHEIHNEPELRDEVEAGLVDFVNCVLEK